MTGPKLNAELNLSSNIDTKGPEIARKVKEVAESVIALGALSKQMSADMNAVTAAAPASMTPALNQLKATMAGIGKLGEGLVKEFKGQLDQINKDAARGGAAAGKGFASKLAEALKSSDSEVRSAADVLSKSTVKSMAAGLKSAEPEVVAAAKRLRKGVQEELDREPAVVKVRMSTKAIDMGNGVKLTHSVTGSDKESLSTLIGTTALAQAQGVATAAKAATDATKALETSSNNLLRNAAFAKKTLEKQLEIAQTIKELSKLGNSQAQLREDYGTKAVWASQNVGKVQAKAEAEALRVQTAGLERDKLRDMERFGKERATLASKLALDEVRARDLNAQFAAMSPVGKLARATRVAGVATDGPGSDYATSKYGTAALAASSVTELDALRQQAAEARNSAAALKILGTEKSTTAAKAKLLAAEQSNLNAAMRDGHSAARGLASGFGAMWLTWGNLAPLLAGAAVSNGIVQVVKMGAAVDQSMQTIQALSGATAAEVANLNAQMLELARSGPFGPLEVAEAMKVMSLAGLDAGKVSTAVVDVMNLSVAGSTSIKDAADVMTSVATSFGIAAEGYNYVGDVIAKTAAVSKASVESIGQAFKTASVLGKQYGVTLEDVGVGLAALSNLGIQGSAAGTALRNMYADLSGRTDKTSKILKAYNLDLRDQYGNFKDILTITKSVSDALDKFKDPKDAKQFIHDVFSERGGKPLVELLDKVRTQALATGDTVSSRLEVMRQEILDSAGFMAVASAQMALTPLNEMKSVSASLQATIVETFNGMGPTVTEVSENLKRAFAGPEFKAGLQSLTELVGSLTVTVTEHIGMIIRLAEAYVAFKAFQGVSLLFTTLTTAVMSASAVMAGPFRAAAASATVAYTGVGVAAEGAAVGMTAASVAATGAVRLIPVIGQILGLAAGAWALYEMWTAKATTTGEAAASSTYSQRLVGRLNEETLRLNENTEALRANMTVQQLRVQKDLKAASEAKVAPSVAVYSAQTAVDKAEKTLSDAKSSNSTIAFVTMREREVKAAKESLTLAQRRAEWDAKDVAYGIIFAQIAARRNADEVKTQLDLAKSRTTSGTDAYKGTGKPAKLNSALKESQEALTTQIKLMQLAQDNADRQFANTSAVDKRAESIRGFATEMESESMRIAAVAKADSQYAMDVQKAIKQAHATTLNTKSTPEAALEAKESLKLAIDELNVKRDTTLDAIERAKVDSGRIGTLKMALDLANQEKVVMVEKEAAYQDLTKLDEARNELALIGKNLTVAQLAEVKRVSEVEAAGHAFTYESLAAELALRTEIKRITDLKGDSNIDIGYSITQAAQQYEDSFNASLRKRNTALAQADVKAATTTRSEYQKVFDSMGGTLADALTTGGSQGAKKVGDFLREELLRKPFRMIIQAIMSPITGGLTQMISGVGGSGGDIFGLANIASSLSNLYSAGSSIVTIGSQVAAGTMGVANALGTLAANATGTGISGLLAANGAYGTAAAGTASAAAGGMTGMLAAIPGWGWAALGVAALAGIASGRGETRSGAAYVTGADGKAAYQQGPSGGEIAGSDARRLFTVATDSINAALAAVGSKAKLTGFVAGLESSKNGKGFDYAGGSINGVAFGESGGRNGGQFAYKSQTAEQAFANYTVQLKQATVQALQAAADVPKTIHDMLSSVDANALTGEAVDALLSNIKAVVGTVNSFNQTVLSLPFANLKNLSFDAAAGLLAVTGGLDKLGTNLNAYYEAYYSADERMATTTTNVATALQAVGVTMPTTKDAFRALVTGLDLTSEAGRNTYAVMLAVAPEFAKVADAANTAADASVKLMTDVFDTLDKRLTSLVESIASERESVAGARAGILNGGPKTYAQLQAGIAAAKVALPSDAPALAAQNAAKNAGYKVLGNQQTLTAAQRDQAWWQRIVDTSTLLKTQAIDFYKGKAAELQNLASSNGYAVNSYSISGGAVDMRNTAGIYNPANQTFSKADYRSYNSYAGYRGIDATEAQYQTLRDTINQADTVIRDRSKDLANLAPGLAYWASMTANAQDSLLAATAAKTAADANAKAAIMAYANAMTQYSGDAEKAVKVLSKLREETVAYYEAQKALASTMSASAAGLRSAVASLATSQLDPMALTLQKQREFAKDYSMALSTTGADKAGYADKMAAALPGLSEALKATSSMRDWSIQTAKLAAQSSAIAASLETAASGMNYEAESLGLLGSIDLALNELDTNTAILKSAIDSGTNSTAANLRVIARQLGGVPAFAGGGSHSGGIRWVGENGPELEVTGPSRIFNASQLRASGGQQDNSAIVAELRAIRQENAELRAELRAITIHTANTADATRRMDKNGVQTYNESREPHYTVPIV